MNGSLRTEQLLFTIITPHLSNREDILRFTEFPHAYDYEVCFSTLDTINDALSSSSNPNLTIACL